MGGSAAQRVYAYASPGVRASAWTSIARAVPDGSMGNVAWALPWRPFAARRATRCGCSSRRELEPAYYDIIQWTVNPDFSAPIEVKYVNGGIDYHYGNGVVVHSGGYPNEPVGGEGGACFVGTTAALRWTAATSFRIRRACSGSRCCPTTNEYITQTAIR